MLINTPTGRPAVQQSDLALEVSLFGDGPAISKQKEERHDQSSTHLSTHDGESALLWPICSPINRKIWANTSIANNIMLLMAMHNDRWCYAPAGPAKCRQQKCNEVGIPRVLRCPYSPDLSAETFRYAKSTC